MRISDWSSDVCSSDLLRQLGFGAGALQLCLRLVECRLVGARVDDEQQVAILPFLAFVERDALHVAAHARAQLPRFAGGYATVEGFTLVSGLAQHGGGFAIRWRGAARSEARLRR